MALPLVGLIGTLIGAATSIFTKKQENDASSKTAQNAINLEEVKGAPSTIFRSWRAIFFFALTIIVIYELLVVPLVKGTWGVELPVTGQIENVFQLLMGGLGL